MRDAFPYTRVGPRAGGWFGKSSLWVGADHLLLVKNRYFTEDYLRFQLRDIQAVIVRKQARFSLPLSGIFVIFVAIIFLVILSRLSKLAWIAPAAWAVAILVTAAWLAISLLWSCSCHIQTAVGVQEIPSLRRIWRARAALHLLEEKISAAQGVLPDDWQTIDRVTLAENEAATLATRTASTEPEPPPPINSRPVMIAMAALAGVLVDALFSWLLWRDKTSQVLRVTGLSVTLLALGLCIFALIAVRRHPRLSALRNLLLFTIIVVGIINYASVAVSTMTQLGMRVPVNDYLFWLNEVAELVIAAIGFFLLLDLRRGEPSAP